MGSWWTQIGSVFTKIHQLFFPQATPATCHSSVYKWRSLNRFPFSSLCLLVQTCWLQLIPKQETKRRVTFLIKCYLATRSFVFGATILGNYCPKHYLMYHSLISHDPKMVCKYLWGWMIQYLAQGHFGRVDGCKQRDVSLFSPAKGSSFHSVRHAAAEHPWTWRTLQTTRQWDTQWRDNKCNKYSCAPIMLMFNRVLVLLSDRFWLIVCQGRYSVSESDARRQGRNMNMMNPTLL